MEIGDYMKIVEIGKNNVPRLNGILDWLIYIISYAFILIGLSAVLPTLDLDNSYYGLYGLLAALIIYVLNKTIKPILFKLTIPITGITMGLFYPCINILILKITDWILLSHFTTSGIFSLFFTAILISFVNIIVEQLIIKPILKRSEKK